MKRFSKNRKKKAPKNLDMPLQITSMADIFMILLVFLLKSFATAATPIAPTKDTRLPSASAAVSPKDAVRLEVSRDAISIDQNDVVKLTDFRLAAESTTISPAETPLGRTLGAQRAKLPSTVTDPVLLVLADERAPTETIKAVLASAAVTGFVDVQLLVVKEE